MPKAQRSKTPAYLTRQRGVSDLAAESDHAGIPARETADPASIAASLLLEAALKEGGITAAEAGQDGSIGLVILRDNCWNQLVRDAWASLSRLGDRMLEEWRDYRENDGWLAWAPEAEPSHAQHRVEAERFAKAVARGRHCIGFATDAVWLPDDLVNAADYRLTLSAVSVEDVTLLAGLLCGALPAEELTAEEAARLTPRLLRLARRIGQTADAYIMKLRDLLERDATASAVAVHRVATHSPRDTPTLERLHGMDAAVGWGADVARDLRAFRDGSLAWAGVDRGCLLSGPSGCGKTLFARALATTCGVPLVVGSYGQWLGSGQGHQGDLLKGMRKAFADARASKPSILFIDEIDSFPNRATITHHYADWETQVVNALLAEVDGADGREGVILLAACNHPEKLDPALVRAGRLDRHIPIQLPNRAALAAILRERLGDDLVGENLSGAAMAAAGASGADCELIVRGARRRARLVSREMQLTDLLAEIGGTDFRSPDDIWLAAVHEAGHVVAAFALQPSSIDMVTLNGREGSGGHTNLKAAGSVYARSSDIHWQLITCLAGRAAEHEVLGTPSSGAGGRSPNDLAQATELAARSDTAFGFSDDGSLAWRGFPDIHKVPEILAADPALARRVQAQLEAAYSTARKLMRARLSAVHALAHALVAKRVLDGAEACEIIRAASGEKGGQR